VPPARVPRWFENFGTRHGAVDLVVREGALRARAADGATAHARLPWGRPYAGPADPAALARAAGEPLRWGVLLVRRGGFAVAAGTGPEPAHHKVGRRHVQGRTKAGGWSQQRFARRRDNQARQAFEAAAEHAHRILLTQGGGVDALVCGGDRAAVASVLADPRLASLERRRVEPWLAVGDPGAEVLRTAVADAHSVRVELDEPGDALGQSEG
jgi:hypothetical protein